MLWHVYLFFYVEKRQRKWNEREKKWRKPVAKRKKRSAIHQIIEGNESTSGDKLFLVLWEIRVFLFFYTFHLCFIISLIIRCVQTKTRWWTKCMNECRWMNIMMFSWAMRCDDLLSCTQCVFLSFNMCVWIMIASHFNFPLAKIRSLFLFKMKISCGVPFLLLHTHIHQAAFLVGISIIQASVDFNFVVESFRGNRCIWISLSRDNSYTIMYVIYLH